MELRLEKAIVLHKLVKSFTSTVAAFKAGGPKSTTKPKAKKR